MNYCDVIYDPCLNSLDINRIQKLQNCCFRLIYGIRKYDHISNTFILSKWLNMKNRRYIYADCFFHKILKTKSPAYLYNKITFRTDVPSNIKHSNIIKFRKEVTQIVNNKELYG